jgi:site-specific DNA recombinase
MENQPKSKCFVYLRRSQDREDRQQLSIEKQDRITRELVAKYDLEPIFLPPEDRSAKNPGRPIFKNMMDRIEGGEAEYIAGWVISRLSRNAVDGGRIIQALDTGKLKAIYTPGRVFTNTTNDKMFLAFEFAIAKRNNDDLGDQVKEGFETKRSHGQYPGPAPLGYLNAIVGPGQRNIVPNPETSSKVIKLFELAATGAYALDELWKEAANIRLGSRAGKMLGKQTIAEMLQRRTYTGVFKYGGDEWHQGSYEPLISVELYDKVQVAMGWKKRSAARPATTSGRHYTYKGLLLCQTCKFNITAYTKPKQLASGRSAEYVFYTCTKKNKKIKCKEPQLSDKLLETEVLANMQKYEITEADGKECSRWLDHHYKEFIKERTRYRPLWLQDLRQAKSALDVLDSKLESGTISDERYKQRAAKHETEIARTTKLLKAADTDADRWLELAKETFSGVVNLGEVFQEADDREKRQLMIFVGLNWHLGNKKVVLTPRKPLDLLSVSDRNPNWRARPDSNRRSPP